MICLVTKECGEFGKTMSETAKKKKLELDSTSQHELGSNIRSRYGRKISKSSENYFSRTVTLGHSLYIW